MTRLLAIQEYAKAIAAYVGAILTALIASGVIPTGSWYVGLTLATVITTAVATYVTPNASRDTSND